ncbi:MAG: EamA family transporter [Gemmatimonadetes bacterium]|nr:EamA family transporter [Gemmatimonadota bacterium]
MTGFLYLMVVYFVWGSTYLAIRLGVAAEAGFPPFYFGATRFLAAGLMLLAFAMIKRQRVRLTARELRVLAITGVMLCLGGNGLVVWAEQRAESGYAALLVGSMPIWVAIAESILDRKAPTVLLVLSLVLGFIGLGVLTYPVLSDPHGETDALSVVALLVAPILWGLGSLYYQRNKLDVAPSAGAGIQMLFGAAALFAVALIQSEPAPDPSRTAWFSWWYLVLFGSVLAYTSFMKALRLLPASIVMTYAYVNPVVAVFLGWLVLRENVTAWTLAGTALIVAGVAGTFRARRRT